MAVAIVGGTLVAREADRRRQAEQREREIAEMHAEYQRSWPSGSSSPPRRSGSRCSRRSTGSARHCSGSVSHDLRTPLGDHPGGDVRHPCRRRRTTGAPATSCSISSADEAERLDRLVANLLSLSRIEAGALDPRLEPTDLTELIEAASRTGSGVCSATTSSR